MSDSLPHTPPPLIPRNVLFGDPLRSSPRVSPDAVRLAYLAPREGVLNIWAGAIDDALDRFEPITDDRDRGIRTFFWSQDGARILYLQDVGGNENWRLYAVDVATREARDLTPFENVQARVIDSHRDHPDELLIGLNRDDPRLHDVYHLRLSTGELTKVASNPGNIAGWLVDESFTVRGATAMEPDGSARLLLRQDVRTEPADWSVFRVWSDEDALSSRAVGFTKDGLSLYLIDSAGVNAGRLTIVDVATGATQVLAEDAQYDVGGVMLHPETRALQAVTFNRDRIEWQFFDPAFAQDFAHLAQVRPGEISIVSRDRGDRVWIAAFYGDTSTTRFSLYDRASRSERFLFSSKPDLDHYTLAPMQPVQFQSRDGLTIHGYLTLPLGRDPKSLPLVLDVHGGPWSRDAWGLNAESQLFANRGYATLQLNYRGSTGYGKSFLNAGNHEWAGRMHDDLIDGVRWIAEQGVVDPKRVAIYGGSYGGYAALVGAAFTPDEFCCAVDIVGPSNLITLIETIPPYWHVLRATFTKRLGDPVLDAEFLKSRSPLFKVDRIKIPMLIAQGANDPRVKKAESDQIVGAMRERGIACEYIVFDDEGHGFVKPANRLKFYAAAERFLSQHLGGRYEE